MIYKSVTAAWDKFFKQESATGIVLFAFALLALIVANSPLGEDYVHFLHSYISLGFDSNYVSISLAHLINDGLMAIFFLLVGLEIKREFLHGELNSPRKAALPFIAAVGGMIFPALIFTFFNYQDEIAMRGWAIPVATDIAFSLGVLALLASRVPVSLKIFLTAIAVIDDLLAILIIAVFYTSEIKLDFLMGAAIVFALMLLAGRLQIRSLAVYLIGFALMWVLMLNSGVHATIAGVLSAMAIPLGSKQQSENSSAVALEHILHKPVSFIILPVFAFANAGVALDGITIYDLGRSVPLGIMLGLMLGKVIGISGFIYLAIKLRLAVFPAGVGYCACLSLSMLCAIGFTVSLFIGNLAFGAAEHEEYLRLVKIGVLVASTLAGILGVIILSIAYPKKQAVQS